jgi:hypothetical protein
VNIRYILVANVRVKILRMYVSVLIILRWRKMERLGFYSISVILSYLSETEGVSLLITKSQFALQILPIFRQPASSPPLLTVKVNDDDQTDTTTTAANNHNPTNFSDDDTKIATNTTATDRLQRRHRLHRKRYQFSVSPVQDPNTLLDRLNTRRLFLRYRHHRRQLQQQQQQGAATAVIIPINTSTSEMAHLEWQQQQQNSVNASSSSSLYQQFEYPPELELLRFQKSMSTDTTRANCTEFQSLCLNHHRQQQQQSTILIVSFPRSGNTLVRSLLERTTGNITGSDSRPDRSLSKELAEQHDLVGEGVVASSRVVYVKSHYPERLGNQMFEGHAAIVLVRNPYDAIDSYWNMNATKSHTKSLVPEMYTKFHDLWHGLVKNEIQIWNQFLDYWLREDCPIPILLVRFEDIIRNPQQQVQRMIQFTLQYNNINQISQSEPNVVVQLSNFWLSRIQHCTTATTRSAVSNIETLGSYQPRSAATSGVASIGKSLRTGHYSKELISYIQDTCAMNYSENYLKRFGYDVQTQDFPNNFINDRESPFVDSVIASRQREYGTSVTVRVNDGISIRPNNCPYGRRLQQWRHSMTDDDRHPLPTMAK